MCEVQGYVYAALVARSHFATEGGDTELAEQLRARAEALKAAFNRDFWLDEQGFFAMALDADKTPVDGLASNMGHCLWTGIVDEEKAPLVAKHLLADELFCGWGVRTLAENVKGYNPISYHCGSVWPHDNAIAAAGLMRYGFVEEAHQIMEGMIAAAPFFDNRLPELFAGLSRDAVPVPGDVPDVVLAAGVGGGVAAAVPAHDAALRARHPQRHPAPDAAGARVDRHAGPGAGTPHGRLPVGPGRRRPPRRAGRARRPDDRVEEPRQATF